MKRKEKKCKICGSMFLPRNSLHKFCNYNCALADTRAQASKEWDRETRRRKKELKQNDTSHWREKAQAAFNAFVRERDKDLPCVSCGRWADAWDAGHYRSRGAMPALRFNEDNVHKQCKRPCNADKSGNIIGFRKGLLVKIGEARLAFIEKDHPLPHYRVEDYKRIHKQYVDKLKGLRDERQES